MSFHYHSYKLPELQAVSPIDPRPYTWGTPPLPELNENDNDKSRLSEISLGDDDITASQSPFPSLNHENESGDMLPENHRSSSIQRIPVRSSALESKSRRLFSVWTIAISAVISTTFSLYYSYTVLFDTNALPTHLVTSPGTTVLIVNILSHVVAFLVWCLFSDTFEALRWALASSPKGILLTSFLALSRATPLSGVLYLCTTRGNHQLWAIWRLLQMALVTVLGLVLITNVTFKNVYTASSNAGKINVVAGLAPLNAAYLSLGTRDILSLYTATYSMGFITDPKFVTSIPPLECSGDDCMAIFLPGGLDLARRDDANSTLFDSAQYGDYTTIVIDNAPGYHLEFDALPANYTFEPSNCTVYEQSINDGLMICLQSDGPRMLAGWSICSTPIKDLNACYTNTTWMNSTDWGVKVSLFQRMATVAYDRLNVSILTIESIGPPSILPITPSDFRKYHNIVLGSIPETPLNSTASDFSGFAVSYTAQYGLGWLLRLYKDRYEEYHNGGLDVLKGFLGVSFQFSTMMWSQWGFDTLPQNMHTTATLQKASYRALIEAWTLWAFGGIALLVISWSIACLMWVHFWGPFSPNASFFPEIDIVSKSSYPAGIKTKKPWEMELRKEGSGKYYVERDDVDDLARLTRIEGLGNGMSRAVVDGIRGRRVFCGSDEIGDCDGTQGRQQMVVIVTEKDKVAPFRKREMYV